MQLVEALFGLAEGPCVLRMHVNAIGTAVDLRCAKLEEMEELGFDGGVSEIVFDRKKSSQGFLGELTIVESWFHGLRAFPSRRGLDAGEKKEGTRNEPGMAVGKWLAHAKG